MKIAFNGCGCGFTNNGGSQTVYRTAMALAKLGHEVEVWADSPNGLTWFPLKGATYRKTKLIDAPGVDVLFATSCRTVLPTYEFNKTLGVNWVRAIETWTMPEAKLIEDFKLDMPIFVNSTWMQKWIGDKTGRTDIEVMYPGLPMEMFYDTGDRRKNFTIGCLHSPKPRKNWKVFVELMKKMKGSNIDFIGFGAEDCPQKDLLDFYTVNPPEELKRRIYSMCDLWFAPTYSEGLHIPPMEAGLCGATIVANRVPSAGVEDSCIDGETALLFGNTDEALKAVKRLQENEKLREELSTRHMEILQTKIGSIEENAVKMSNRLGELCQEKLDAPRKKTDDAVFEKEVGPAPEEYIESREQRKRKPRKEKVVGVVKKREGKASARHQGR